LFVYLSDNFSFDSWPISIQVTEESGYFRTFAFGQVSVYKSDLDSVGGFNTSINGWGIEDTDLYEKVII